MPLTTNIKHRSSIEEIREQERKKKVMSKSKFWLKREYGSHKMYDILKEMAVNVEAYIDKSGRKDEEIITWLEYIRTGFYSKWRKQCNGLYYLDYLTIGARVRYDYYKSILWKYLTLIEGKK